MMTHEQRLEWFKEHFGDLPDYNHIVAWLLDRGFFVAPAPTQYHGNYPGGLFDHCANVAEMLEDLTCRLNLVWERKESPRIVGFFHDLCKIDNYEEDFDGFTYNDNALFKGHGDKSLILLSFLLLLTEEEAACIRYHMGAFTEKKEWSDYTRAVRTFPNVLFTHTADMMAAHIIEKGE